MWMEHSSKGSVDFCVEGATYHAYVRFCCQCQVQITYHACTLCKMHFGSCAIPHDYPSKWYENVKLLTSDFYLINNISDKAGLEILGCPIARGNQKSHRASRNCYQLAQRASGHFGPPKRSKIIFFYKINK